MKETIRLSSPLQCGSVVDGEGIRMVIWNQGCRLKCPGCHNPETHDEQGGREIGINQLLYEIWKNCNGHQGITLSGGDPFLQPIENKQIADYVHTLGLDVWAYCGQTFEQLILEEEKRELLESCDVLVDGPFILSLADKRLAFRGSTNQRIIDVKKSLKKGEVVLYL